MIDRLIYLGMSVSLHGVEQGFANHHPLISQILLTACSVSLALLEHSQVSLFTCYLCGTVVELSNCDHESAKPEMLSLSGTF
jgi:hypothetical protein